MVGERGRSGRILLQVPPDVVGLVRDWEAHGRLAQPGIAWPRDRWLATFPEHRSILRNLPERLTRDDVRTACADAAVGPLEATAGFIVTMAWGYGKVGYGPWRSNRVLTAKPDSSVRLLRAANFVANDGAVAAYDVLRADIRLRWLGPAFATKFLYFCPSDSPGPLALILDRLVATWLRVHTGIDLNPVRWSAVGYEGYLRTMTEWSEELGVKPDVIEEQIFIAQSMGTGSQWDAQTNTAGRAQ